MRVVFFTAGSTGAGHVMRGLAIGRGLERIGFRGTYTMVGPRRELALEALAPVYRGVAIDHEELLDPARARASELARTLDELRPHLLVVDLFWGPLVRLLPRPGCEAWLLVRRVYPQWLLGNARMAFDRSQYARLVAIEPGLDLEEEVAPVVIANPDELRPASHLRDRLGVGKDERLSVVAQVGVSGEWRKLVDASRDRAHVFTMGDEGAVDDPRIRIHDGATFFPLATWLAGADAIASGAGYNSFWEAQWLGHASRTRFVAFKRKLDDQAWRVRHCSGHTPRFNGADVLAAQIARA